MSDLPERLRRSARSLRLVTIGATMLVALVFASSAWVLISGRRADFPFLRIDDQGMAAWPVAVSLLLVGLLVVLALVRLMRMLRRVEGGAPFGAARELRGFAYLLFLSVAASILVPPLLQLAVGGEGVRRIDLSMSMNDALMLLVTGLLFFVARLLDEAQRVADDASQIV